jgi:hypothetical protein
MIIGVKLLNHLSVLWISSGWMDWNDRDQSVDQFKESIHKYGEIFNVTSTQDTFQLIYTESIIPGRGDTLCFRLFLSYF